ncbi:MAG: DUF2399 domain-containing protein [Chloroflexi bacterium]|nr:DUF2399 domain-containing protein [Chloroflexota bacterium]
MKPDLTPTARAVLASLLDRYEQPGRQRVVRVRLNEKEHAAYFSPSDSTPRRESNAALGRLAEQGLVKLHWLRWQEDNWLDAVDLVPESAAAAFALLDRTPLNARESALRELLAAQTPRVGWHADSLAWANQQLDAHRSVAPLDLDEPQQNLELLRALAAVADLRGPILERKLSVQLFDDSKRLQDLRRAILVVLRRHAPDAADYGDDEWALLHAHQLERVPEYVPIAGPLVLQRSGSQFDLTPFSPSVAIPATTLQSSTVARCAAAVVVAIENATSFSEFASVRPASVLAVFTGGFASPAVIALLQSIRAARPEAPFMHWGDLDAGGLLILAHLRSKLGRVAPLAMDVATFQQFCAHAQPLNTHERAALERLQTHPQLADCTELIQHLLESDGKLEQEAIDAAHLVGLLGADR